jgi:hypothetical protein
MSISLIISHIFEDVITLIMKKLLFLLSFCISLFSVAQTPQGINYQAAAHDASGNPLANQNATIRIGILSSSPSGTLEWEEEHTVATNDYGLFNLVIGTGTSTGLGNQVTFADINWSLSTHFLKVELDAGSGFELVGTMQFMSVPYALHAETVANDNVNDADSDPNNELITGAVLNGDNLEISDAGGTQIVDLSPLTSAGSDTAWNYNGNDIYNFNSGNIGIGTMSPTLGKLQIESFNGTELYFNSTGFHSNIHTNSQFMIGTDNTSPVHFLTDGLSRIVIDGLGHVGINNGTPDAFLDVVGSFQYDDGNQQAGYVLTTDALGNASWQPGSNDTLSIIRDSDNDTKIQVEESPDEDIIRFDIGGTEMMVLDDKTLQLGGTNVFIGNLSGSSNTTGLENTSLGQEALNFNTIGDANTAIGNRALKNNSTGLLNTAVGSWALISNTSGSSNTALGRNSLRDATANFSNTAIGESAGVILNSGDHNTFIGTTTAGAKTSGSNNVFLGSNSGFNNTTGNGNIFLGYNSGSNSTGSDLLYIENSNSVTPLIYGDFANDSLKIYGSLSIGNAFTFPTADGTNGQVMTTDGAGNTSWQNISAGDFFSNGSVPMSGNMQLAGNYISNDGDSEGISILNNGQVQLTPATTGAGNYAVNALGDIRTQGLGTGLHLTNNQIKITGNDGNAGNMHFYTGSTERMRIHAGGNVEVYNRTQTNTLTVSSGAGTAGNVLTDDGTGNAVWTLPTGDNDWSMGANVIYNVTDSVGIGTFSPRTKLEIYGNSNETNLYAFNGSPGTTLALHNDDLSNSNYSSISFSARASNNGNYNSARIVAVNQNHTAGSMTSDLVFMTRNTSNITEAMRITGDDRIGMGTVNPSTDLHLVGSMRIEDGSQAAGNVLTSDAAGNASWKPKAISFFEGMDPSNGTQTITQSVNTKLQFLSNGSAFAMNDGAGYSNAAYEFQAPVAGVYQFNINMVFAGAPSGYFTMVLMHSSGNGISEKNGFFNSIAQNWYTDNMHVTVHLNAGESVWVEAVNTNGGMSFYQGKSSFSGHLVYAD